VFLKEGILSIHMRAVEKSVAIDDVVPKRFVNVGRVVIFFVFDVVFMRWDIFLDNFRNWGIIRGFITILGGSFFLSFCAAVAFIESLLEAAELVIKVDENIGARNLHERFIPRF
jgi:hypothetical protein